MNSTNYYKSKKKVDGTKIVKPVVKSSSITVKRTNKIKIKFLIVIKMEVMPLAAKRKCVTFIGQVSVSINVLYHINFLQYVV